MVSLILHSIVLSQFQQGRPVSLGTTLTHLRREDGDTFPLTADAEKFVRLITRWTQYSRRKASGLVSLR